MYRYTDPSAESHFEIYIGIRSASMTNLQELFCVTESERARAREREREREGGEREGGREIERKDKELQKERTKSRKNEGRTITEIRNESRAICVR